MRTGRRHSDSVQKQLGIFQLKDWLFWLFNYLYLLFISQLQTLSTIQFQIFYQIATICSKIKHPKGKLASPSAWLICSSSLPQPLGGSAGSAIDAQGKSRSQAFMWAGDGIWWYPPVFRHTPVFFAQKCWRWASTAENNCTLSIVCCGGLRKHHAVRFRMAPTCRMLVEPSWPLVHPLFAFLGFLDVRKKVFWPKWHFLELLYLPWLSPQLLFLSLNFSGYIFFHSEHTHV